MKTIYSIKFIIIICWVFLNKNINCCKTGCSCKKKGNKNPNNEIRIIRPQKHIKNNKSLVPGNKKPKSNEIKKNTTEKTNINNNYNGQSKNLNDETHKNKNNKNIKKKDTNTISIENKITKDKNITNKANIDIKNKNKLINKPNNFDKNNNEINNINENGNKASSSKKNETNKINNETNNNLNYLKPNINIDENKIDTNKSKIDINKSNTTKNNKKIVNTKNKDNINTTNLNNPKNNNDSDNKLNIPKNNVINPESNIQKNKNTTNLNNPENNNNNNTESNIQNNKNNSDKNNDNINPIKNSEENKNNTVNNTLNNNNTNEKYKGNNINIPPKIDSNLNKKNKQAPNINKPNDTTNNNLAKKNNNLNNNDILKNLPVNNENTINNDSNNNSNLNNNIKYNTDLDKKKEKTPDINNTTKIENINKDKEQLEQLEQLEHQYKGKNKKTYINDNNIHNPGSGINNTFINSKIKNNKNLNNGNINNNNIQANNIINNNSSKQEKHKEANINQQKNKKCINVDHEYEEMYNQMSQYFKDDFIFELINERKNLKGIGICNALDNIITDSLIFIPYFKNNKDKKNTPTHTHVNLDKKKKIKNGIKSTNIHTDLATIYDKKGFDDLKDEFIFPSGAIFIENEYFKYLRCKGKCKSKKCVSCKLRKYLKEKGLAELFILIYLNQGNSSRSEYSNYIKKIINEGLKEEIKKKINYYWNKEVNTEDLDDEGENIKKCFFIEWALTIEFLTRFSKILSADGNLTLYRVVQIDGNKIEKISPYESTSIFGQPFIPQYQNGKEKCFIVERAEIWRCIFSYIISPDDKSMFYSSITDPTERKYLNSLDYELEIGYIPIGKEKYYKYNGSIDNAHNELEKKCKEFYNQNINKIYDKDKNLLLKFQNNITTLIEGDYKDYKSEEEEEDE